MFPFFIIFFISYSSAQKLEQNLYIFNISSSPWLPTQNRILTSPNSVFAAGFRPSPTIPRRYFFAIWYRNISIQPIIIWSATANSPITNSSSLSISPSGVLSLTDNTSGNNNHNLWPQTATAAQPKTSQQQLVLLNDGNLVYGNWSSFAFPTNTIVPNQQINGTTLVSNNRKFMFRNSSSLVFNSSSVYWSIPVQILRLSSNGGLIKSDVTSFIPKDFNANNPRRLSLDDDGNLRVYSFDYESNRWVVVWEAIQEPCIIHGTCNPNYICMSNGNDSVSCICPPGFHEIKTDANDDSSTTCDPKPPTSTNPKDTKFLQLDFVNFSGGSNQTDRKSPNFATCQSDCLRNPRCLGFGYKFTGKNYCVHQIDRLLFGRWSPGTETAMFIKVSNKSSDSDQPNFFTGMTSKLETTCPIRITLPLPPDESNANTRDITVICAVFAIELLVGVLAFSAFLNKYAKYRSMAQTLGLEFITAGAGAGGPRRFTYEELKTATKNFTNVVGHGGFGIVYKGELPDHRIIAVKRLKAVGKGETEFWAEVTIIARMHHLNLVQMWGFCADKSQKMLVYEYVPNGSLDKFLFSSTHERSSNPRTVLVPILGWDIRYRIAIGVARAIAYLHEECLEWVLHCDIKPENILLENDFCPKVSDFGLAKLAKKQDMVSMSRIRGTRGYMAPEWVRPEPITAKADVYSFGMVLLEIVSGIRNLEFRESSKGSEEWYFPGWAYEKAVEERKVDEILDCRIMECYEESVHFEMVDRMVKTAMWCLQDRPEMRPSMGKVAKMLEGAVEIHEPGKPTIFYLGTQDDDT